MENKIENICILLSIKKNEHGYNFQKHYGMIQRQDIRICAGNQGVAEYGCDLGSLDSRGGRVSSLW